MQDATGHLYTNTDGISAVIICDNEYPTRVAFDLIAKILKKYSESNYSDKTQTYLDEVISKYQQPENIDSIMRVQRDLEETKVVLVYNALISICSTRQLGPFWNVERKSTSLFQNLINWETSQNFSSNMQRKQIPAV